MNHFFVFVASSTVGAYIFDTCTKRKLTSIKPGETISGTVFNRDFSKLENIVAWCPVGKEKDSELESVEIQEASMLYPFKYWLFQNFENSVSYITLEPSSQKRKVIRIPDDATITCHTEESGYEYHQVIMVNKVFVE